MKTSKKTAHKTPTYKNPKARIADRVKDLLSRMTLEEKANQLLQVTIGQDANPNNPGSNNQFIPTVGSILSFNDGVVKRNQFQRYAIEKTRLGIPLIWGFDVIHGWRTSFPVPLAQACSFDPELTERAARVAAMECNADGGVDWTFSPMVEVCRDPRWGRVVEGFGEDPFTACRFAEATVRGYQGRTPADFRKPGHIAACLKHFVGYSASEGGRDYTYTDISCRSLWEQHLPPFEAGVKAGALTVMSSFNDICGTPVCVNSYLLTDVLRDMFGFKGFVVSDWGSINQLGDQRYTSDNAVKTVDALSAGNDMDMADFVYKNVAELVKSKRLARKVVDTAVARILTVKFQLGLFEHPYIEERPREETCRLPEYLDLAKECALGCPVLLKNERRTLPLNARKVKKVAVIGPGAKDYSVQIGSWCAKALYEPWNGPSLLDAAQEAFKGAQVTYAQGCSFDPDKRRPAAAELAAAVKAANGADVVLLSIGEYGWTTGEYKSRGDINLPGGQAALIDALAKTGVPLVGLVTSGRPLAFPNEAEKLDAIMFLWQCGSRGWDAALDLVTGKANPSGKLAMTFPRYVGQIPTYYCEHSKARNWAHDYQDQKDELDGPWFPFGHGLSYTRFDYGRVRVARRGGKFTAKVTVRNAGGRAGKETVIWYLQDVESRFTQPAWRVVGFEKIDLKPGEEKTVEIALGKSRGLDHAMPDGTREFEPGDFVISASRKSQAKFTA